MPVGVQCSISSSLGEFPSYWDWLWCPGLSPVLVSIAFPFAFHTWFFHSLLSAIGFQSCFFFTADISPPIRFNYLHTYNIGSYPLCKDNKELTNRKNMNKAKHQTKEHCLL